MHCPSQSFFENQPSWESCLWQECQLWQRPSVKAWGWESRFGEKATVGCSDTTEGTGVRGSTTPEISLEAVWSAWETRCQYWVVCRSWGHHHSHTQVPVFTSTVRISHQNKQTPDYCNCLPVYTAARRLPHTPAVTTIILPSLSEAQSAITFLLSCLGGKQMSEGDPNAEMGPKTKPEPHWQCN